MCLSVKPCLFTDKLWIPRQPISVISRSAHSAYGTLFLCIILILVDRRSLDPRLRDSSVTPRLLPDKLLISNNLSVKPHLFTDKLSILSQLFTVIGAWWRAVQPRTEKKLNIHADSPKLVKPSSGIARVELRGSHG